MSNIVKRQPTNLAGRAAHVRERISKINQAVSEYYIETGVLLKEAKENGYWKEWGAYETFDQAIQGLNDAGEIDFGWRNARNFIAVADMLDQAGMDKDELKKLPISKLREIAAVPDVKAQKKLLEAAPEQTTAEVQAAAKKARKKAYGEDEDDEKDPLHPRTFMTTDSQRTMIDDCIKHARQIYGIGDTVPDVAVLVDYILADWKSSAPTIEAEEIEGGLGVVSAAA